MGVIGPSSNGRTAVFGAAGHGSNPCGPILLYVSGKGFFFTIALLLYRVREAVGGELKIYC